MLCTSGQDTQRASHLQGYGMLSAVKGAAPEGAELEAFLGKPCNHMARVIRDLCAPESVQDNLKNVLTFIKNVRPPHALLSLAGLVSY